MANNEDLETRMDIARMKLDSDDQKERRRASVKSYSYH